MQGTKGAYSEIAAKAYFENKPDLETKPCDSFDEVSVDIYIHVHVLANYICNIFIYENK